LPIFALPPERDGGGIAVGELGGALEYAGKQLVQVERFRERGELPRPAKLELRPSELVGAVRSPRAAEHAASLADRDDDEYAHHCGGQSDDQCRHTGSGPAGSVSRKTGRASARRSPQAMVGRI